MALTKVGIVYSLAQNLRRRVIVPDDDGELVFHKSSLAYGEAYIELPYATFQQFDSPTDLDAFLAIELNSANPGSDYCLVVDANDVIQACILADPIIDSHPLGTVIADTPAMVGDTYDFVNQCVVINPNSPARLELMSEQAPAPAPSDEVT